MTAAVLFDIDGTLVDSTYHHALAWQRAWAASAAEVPPIWRIHRAVGMGGDRLVAEVAGEDVENRSGDDLRERWREMYLALRDEVRPLPGAVELIGRLDREGWIVALASSGDPQFSQEAVDLLGVRDQVAALLTSEDVEQSKPDPDLIAETLRRLRSLADVDAAVFIGDTVHDVVAARRAHLPCIALLSGGYGRAELTDAGAVLVVDTLADLLHIQLSHWTRST